MEENRNERQSFLLGFLWGAAAMLLLGAAAMVLLRFTGLGDLLAAGFSAGTARQAVSRNATEKKLETLADLIDEYYYEDVDAALVEEGIYDGLFDSLGDPYSEYYNNREYESFLASTNGSYYGIGVVMIQDPDTGEVSVLRVYSGTPAEEAGLKAGDILLEIDGRSADSEELSQMVWWIKGEEGSSVQLKIRRYHGEKSEELEVLAERRKIQVPTVEYRMLDGNVGFLQISEFTELTAEQFAQAIADLEHQGMEALIVDLRDNPGGVLDGVSEVLDQILPEGIVVYTEDKYGNRTDYESSGDTYLDMPLAVLVNGNSASASEIFAGAIKDYGYGTLIGTRTFGKGIVQSIFTLQDGSAVKVTTAKYFTPLGHNIHEVGIMPDVELEYEYLNPEDEAYEPMHDNQVLKALELFNNSKKGSYT